MYNCQWYCVCYSDCLIKWLLTVIHLWCYTDFIYYVLSMFLYVYIAMIKIIIIITYYYYLYYQYQLFILPKHALVSLYLRSFNKRLNQSLSVSATTNNRSRDWRLMLDRRCESCHKLWFSHYCTAEIEHLCIMLYMIIYNGWLWELCVKCC